MSLTPELRLYNTLTRKKERFEPIHRENERVYALRAESTIICISAMAACSSCSTCCFGSCGRRNNGRHHEVLTSFQFAPNLENLRIDLQVQKSTTGSPEKCLLGDNATGYLR